MRSFDVLVIGGGAAGMMCAIEAARRVRGVGLIERSPEVGRKILISGGGRCNFTNLDVVPERYVSQNPHFAKSALSQFTPADFIQRVEERGIPYHEKKLGQLFCDDSARQIVDLLVGECTQAGVVFFLGCSVSSVEKKESFLVKTNQEDFESASLVIATGGLSLPKTGATDFGYQVARQFGLNIVETAPALDGFVFQEREQKQFSELSGVSIDVRMACEEGSFRENLLFTHSGLSGPAALQASLYWQPGKPVQIDFLPDKKEEELLAWFEEKRRLGSTAQAKNLLAEFLPKRFCDKFCPGVLPDDRSAAQIPLEKFRTLAKALKAWSFTPAQTVGYQRAEVTRGGIDTAELSSQTMEAKKVPGLYFIGEIVDVTGWLGGYNFQWAWASGFAAGQHA